MNFKGYHFIQTFKQFINNIQNNNMGQALLQIDNLSFLNSAFKLKIIEFPLGFFDINHSPSVHGIEGILNADAIFTGVWGNMNGFGETKISQFKLNGINLGNLTLNISPENYDNFTLELFTFNNQFKSKLTIPYDKKTNSKFDVTLNNFDITQILSNEVRAKNNLFSQLTGQFQANGILNSEIFTNPMQMLSRWEGSGKFVNALLQYKRMILNLKESDIFKYSENKLYIPDLNFFSPLLSIKTSGLIDINNKTAFLPIQIESNFSYLKDAFPNIFEEPSSGSGMGKILVSGKFDALSFDGKLSLSAKSIALKNYFPSLTDLNGEINFKNKAIEITKISAHKGIGDISIAGNIDFINNTPNINLRINSSKADFRIQEPIFLFVDLNVDSDISITGQKAPFLISGDLNINKFQIIRDLTCSQISAQALAIPKIDQTITSDPLVSLNLNIKAINTINIRSQCLTGQFSTEPYINLSGTNNEPKINGTITAETATLQVLKTSFDVKKADFQFVDVQKYDPTVDIQMQGRVNTYIIYWKINGRFSQARFNFSADPPVLPNGDRIIEADIISMISTGLVPPQSSNANILSASSGVASFLGVNNFFESTLNQTVSTVTGGLVDNVSITPSSQNGQLSWRANASRSVSQRLNLGVSYEEGNSGNTRTAYANYIFNDIISAISSYNATNYVQQLPTKEFYSGLRFQFRGQ